MLQHDFALVLLDVQMPEMDGFEVAELMRSSERTKYIPIIFVTAGSKGQEQVFKGYESGAVDYIFKPVNPYVLKSKVNIFVDLYKQKHALENSGETLRQTVEQLQIEISDRKRAEEAVERYNRNLELAKAYTDNIIKSMADGLIVVDVQGRVREVNKATLDLLEYAEEELIGQPVGILFGEETLFDGTGLRNLNREGTIRDQETIYKTKNGEEIPVLFSGSVMTDADGHSMGIVGVGRDMRESRLVKELERSNNELKEAISRFKQTEKDLRESEERYRKAIENSNDGVAILKGDQHLYVNQRFADIFGYETPDEVIGKPLSVNVHPDDLQKVTDYAIKRQRGEHVPSRYEHKGIRNDGESVYVEISVARTTHGGEPVSLVFMRDVSDRKKADEALRESESRFSQLYDEAPVGYHELDTEWRITRVNRTELDMLGYRAEEMLGRFVWELIEEMETTRRSFTAKVAGEIAPIKSFDCRFLRKNGTTLPVLVEDRPIRDEKGRIIGHRSTMQDITEQKKMEEERERLIKELQKMNKELKGSNQRLKEATGQLIQSEKLSALGELTAGVAHEMNQPLNGIKIICQSMLRDMEKNRFEEAEVGNDLTEIVNQVNKMAEIIDHMRIYTRHTEGTGSDMIDVNSVLEGPFKLLNQQLKNHNVEVVKELAPDLPEIAGDPIRLEQVFMNLITNARNALEICGREDKRIGIRTYKMNHQSSEQGNSVVAVEVKDNGEGIPEDIREKIFQPFFTTKEPGKGTGLGLSVSSRIIEEHGGRIELESKTGEGTTFRVILPIGD